MGGRASRVVAFVDTIRAVNGYNGSPMGARIFANEKNAAPVRHDALVALGAAPVGAGVRRVLVAKGMIHRVRLRCLEHSFASGASRLSGRLCVTTLQGLALLY